MPRTTTDRESRQRSVRQTLPVAPTRTRRPDVRPLARQRSRGDQRVVRDPLQHKRIRTADPQFGEHLVAGAERRRIATGQRSVHHQAGEIRAVYALVCPVEPPQVQQPGLVVRAQFAALRPGPGGLAVVAAVQLARLPKICASVVVPPVPSWI